MMIRALVIAALCVSVSAMAEEPVVVAVSIPPQAYFVERIAGDAAEVIIAMAPGESPHSFSMGPRLMADLTRAEVYFAIGVEMERQILPRLESSRPDLVIAGIKHENENLESHAHDHDLHVWLDPRQAVLIVEEMARSLIALRPDQEAMFRERCDNLVEELDFLHLEMEIILAPVTGREMVVFHPAFGFLAHAYGLTQVAVEQGGLEPSARHMAGVFTRIEEQGTKTLFVQPQFPVGSAQAIARESGTQLVVLDPLAHDYPANMRIMAMAIVKGLQDD